MNATSFKLDDREDKLLSHPGHAADVVPIFRPRSESAPVGSELLAATSLLHQNVCRFGDSDCMPTCVEHFVLRNYTKEFADCTWAEAPSGRLTSTEWLPLSPLTARGVHLVHPAAFLRLGGVVVRIAPEIERHRSSPQLATAVRISLNRARGTVVQAGQYGRRDDAIDRLRENAPFILRTDVAACFPSFRMDSALDRLSVSSRSQVLLEYNRLGVLGLPVGAVPWRLVAELAMSNVDERLHRAGFRAVRHMDDFWVVVENTHDAARALTVLGDELGLLGLTLNKSKTAMLRSDEANPSPQTPAPRELRQRFGNPQALDRVEALLGLRELRDTASHLGTRERQRWLTLLVHTLGVAPGLTQAILRTIESLAIGQAVSGFADAALNLTESPWSVVRARGVEILGRHGHGAASELLAYLSTTDPSPLVRRESLLALVRLRDVRLVRDVLASPVPTPLDRSMHILAAGALGVQSNSVPRTLYEKLLHTAAREHGTVGPLGQRRDRILPP